MNTNLKETASDVALTVEVVPASGVALVSGVAVTDAELHERWAARIPQWPLDLEPAWLRCAAAYLAGLRWNEPKDGELKALSLEIITRLNGLAR